MKISKSLGIKRGRNDKVDSKAICRYAFEKRDSLEPTHLPSPLITKLKKLLSRRNLLVKQKQALTISLQDQKQLIDPDIYQLHRKLKALSGKSTANYIRGFRLNKAKSLKET